MFTIYADDELLYSPELSNQGYALIEPKLTEELNKSGSLEFTLPTSNVMYDKLQKLKTLITVKLNSNEIWWGRILHDEKDWYNRKHVYCEGMLSYLLDSIVRPYDFQGSVENMFGTLILNHNKQVDESKQFMLGNKTVTDPNNYIHYSSTQYPNTLSEITEKLINTHGGYIKVRRSTVGQNWISYESESGTLSDQTIEFGKNLLDITEYIDATNVFTVLIPLGKKEETTNGTEGKRLTIASVNNGKDYIEDQTAINLFGRIEKVQEWDDVTIASNLLTKGKSALESGIEMAVTLSIKAVDLHLIDVDTSRITLGDYVRVVSEPHGLNKIFLCSKVVTDMQNPDKSEFTFGVSFNAMTDQQINQQKKTQDTYYIAESASSLASNVSVNVSGNYVSKSDFASYQSQVNSNFEKINTGFATKDDVQKKKLILTGAVNAEYDGSNEVTVNIPSGGSSDWSLLTSGNFDLSTRELGFHLATYDAKEFMFVAKVPKTTSATTIYVQSGTGNIFSRSNNNYAFNLIVHAWMVNGNMYASVGAVDGWTNNIPSSVLMISPRTSDATYADYFKLYNGTLLESGNDITYELYGRK